MMDLQSLVGITRGVTNVVLEGATSVGRKVTGGVLAVEEVANASETLLDLRVPETLRTALTPPLNEIGFALHHSEAAEQYGTAMRRFTVAKRGSESRFLIHIPRLILEKFTTPHRDALAAVPYAFARNSIVSVFSQECQVMDFTLSELIEKGWHDDRGVTGTFFPWKYVVDLPGANSQNRRKMITKMLQLQNGSGNNSSSSPIAPAPAARLRPPDLLAMVTILRELSDFQEENGRRVLIELAGLKEQCASVTYGGNPRTVAGEIVLQLDKFGWVKEPPETHALGLLVSYLRDLPDLPNEKKGELRRICQAYKLLPA